MSPLAGRRAGAALPLAVALATLLPIAAPSASAAIAPSDAGRPTATQQAEPAAAPDGPQLTLTSISPVAPKGKGRLTLHGALTTPTAGELTDVRVRLRIGTGPVTSRGELAAIAAGTAETALDTRPVRGSSAAVPAVAADRPGGWEISVPARNLGLVGNGVHVLQVEALSGKGTLAELTTFLPFLTEPDQYDPTRVTWLWPLLGTPARDAHGVFPDDDTLSAALAPGGRLADLAAAPGTRPVTWLLDPELLEAATALAGPHEQRAGRRVTAEPADPEAARWLSELTTALADRPVAATPYADPDVAALTHRNYPGPLSDALARARAVSGEALGRESDISVAWPAAGLADAETLGVLRRAGVRTVILSSAALPVPRATTYTPTARARVRAEGEPIEVLVADAGLASALDGDLRAPGAATLAAQRFLADTALITLERPNEARTLLVTPPRRWNPPVGWAAGLLAAADAAPWLRTVELSALSRLPAAPEYDGATLRYPDAAADAELDRSQVATIRDSAEEAADITRLLARAGGLATSYRGALLRATSSAWRDAPRAGRSFVEDLAATVRADAGRVRVIGRGLVTLSDSRGTIPMTVSNELDQAIRVRPVLRPRVGSRLSVTNPELLTIEAGRKETVRVRAQAAANGITQVDVQLVDADGRPFGPAKPLLVNVRNFGTVGLVVLVIAGGTLFGAAVVRNVRRFRGRESTA